MAEKRLVGVGAVGPGLALFYVLAGWRWRSAVVVLCFILCNCFQVVLLIEVSIFEFMYKLSDIIELLLYSGQDSH